MRQLRYVHDATRNKITLRGADPSTRLVRDLCRALVMAGGGGEGI
jgi:hypothetical protein